MKSYDTWEELISNYGEPVMRFKPQGFEHLSEYKKMHQDIGDEIAVFKLPDEYFEEYIVFSCHRKIEWYANSGQRLVIRELINIIKTQTGLKNLPCGGAF